MVVIGGALSVPEEPILEPMRSRLRELLPEAPTVIQTALGVEASLIGAASEAAAHAQSIIAAELTAIRHHFRGDEHAHVPAHAPTSLSSNA